MTSENSQKRLLEKILSSKEFSHSKIYQTYLTYLVEAACSGKELKETTIAIEVFGKDARFNPAEDTIVRSHTYTLRKKLESYYYNEGKEDKYRLKIPKGHYETTFVPVSDTYHPKTLFLKILRNFPLLIIAALCVLLGLLWKQQKDLETELRCYHITGKDDPIWGEYLQSNLPVLIAVGDHFLFNEYSEKYRQTITIRDPSINSMDEFQSLFPDERVVPSPEPYFPYHSIWSIPPVLSLLYSVHVNPILRKSTDLNPQILDEYNIIFLGSIKTLYTLKHTVFIKSHFHYEISPHKVIYSPPDTLGTQIFETTLHSRGPNEDLVLALKLPGPNKNAVFIIASYHSLGAPEIANYLASPSRRADFERRFREKFGEMPKYFEALFRVTGIDKTAFHTEILIFNKIHSDDSADIS
ncbi:MAG TPA: hypothetical protein ENN17_04680 [bacterium]|nr:hypothetical protein [bacterium]